MHVRLLCSLLQGLRAQDVCFNVSEGEHLIALMQVSGLRGDTECRGMGLIRLKWSRKRFHMASISLAVLLPDKLPTPGKIHAQGVSAQRRRLHRFQLLQHVLLVVVSVCFYVNRLASRPDVAHVTGKRDASDGLRSEGPNRRGPEFQP